MADIKFRVPVSVVEARLYSRIVGDRISNRIGVRQFGMVRMKIEFVKGADARLVQRAHSHTEYGTKRFRTGSGSNAAYKS